MDTQNYKRTLAGSVGAGMGALKGASGRTYFILEHKTSSKYHQAGESQKIIVDQVELGRDASCQVRFDESFETVSRKHAAIVRDGENWKLIHLSHSNPTLVNGHPINGSYYLQTGDEIQLSVGGPRLGFIVPQGRQALTSSIGLTERMSLFRKQALRPYKTALTIMGIVFVLAVAGLAAWNYSLGVKNDLLAQKTEEQELQLKGYQNQLDSLGTERASLEAQQRELETKLRNSDGNAEALKTQLDNVNSQLKNVNASFYKVKSDLDNLSNSISTKSIENSSNAINANIQEGTRLSKDQYYEDPDIADEQDSNASGDLKDYYDYITIDCPPSLSMLTINAMTTADSVLFPIQCEYYALEGLSQLIHTVELVKERLNPVLEIEGVVFTMYDARTNLSLQVVENVKENLQQNIYKTIIPRNIRLAEAPSYGMPINLYDPKSTGASAYQRLADEVMNRE